METVQITSKLLNSILQYLGNRPFVEVANLINAIQQEAANQPQKEEPEQSN